MQDDFISVIISTYNRKDLIGRCLEALLKTRYENYEIIVVDGGSNDGTYEFLKKYCKNKRKVKLLQDKTPGRNPARNTGIKNAKGDILIFVDSDCLVEKDWMGEIIKPFKNPIIGGVIGRTIADKKGLFWYHMENDYLQFIGHNSAYRADIIKKIGGFDLRFKNSREDTDLAWTVMDMGYEMVYCSKAKMTHLSRRVKVLSRIKNQKTFIFDGLLYRKHKKLYKKIFYKHGVSATIWPAIFIPPTLVVFIYSVLFYQPLALTCVLFYLIVVLSKLMPDKDGSLTEKTSFILLLWLIPIAKLYYFTKGYLMFREAR